LHLISQIGKRSSRQKTDMETRYMTTLVSQLSRSMSLSGKTTSLFIYFTYVLAFVQARTEA